MAAARFALAARKRLAWPSRRDLRFVTGLVLFTYLTGHLVNHALGLISLAAAEAGLDIATSFWQSPAGTLLLYGSALTHMGLALDAVYQRRTLRMPFRDLLRIALGLNLPVLLIAHAASTRLAMEAYGYNPFYADVVRDLWQQGHQGRQFAILAPGWIHGCLGLNAAFGRHKWWRDSMPILFGVFLVLPILSALGFVDMHREIVRFDPPMHNGDGLAQANIAAIAAWRDRAVDIYLALVALAFLARLVRWAIERSRGAVVEVSYPTRSVRVPRGWSVLEASRANLIAHPSACGGRARCSTCRVRVTAGLEHCAPASGDEAATLLRIAAPSDVRLACQLRPNAPVSVVPLLGARDASVAAMAREETYAILFVDLIAREELARALLPQDLQWVLSGLYRAFDEAVRGAGGLVLHVGQEHASAVFAGARDVERASRRCLAAARALQSRVGQIGQGLDRHWRAAMHIAITAHVGPVLLDPVELSKPDSRIVVAVGPGVDDMDLLRELAAQRRGGLVVSETLLASARENPDAWGEPADAHALRARIDRIDAPAPIQ
ncbi:MAG: 2Fe-2S iron-sulfur cluster binding domain-containing protein [Hyphomicrobiales bacterium]|nr:2Fe-2S iron-sulfur cluster binding domain-containing protein [Hyphomicrobiales bacterium]